MQVNRLNICRLSTGFFLSICGFFFMGVFLEAKKKGCGSLIITIIDITESRTALCTSYLASAWVLEFAQRPADVKRAKQTLGLGLPAKYSALESIGQRASCNLSERSLGPIPSFLGIKAGPPPPIKAWTYFNASQMAPTSRTRKISKCRCRAEACAAQALAGSRQL